MLGIALGSKFVQVNRLNKSLLMTFLFTLLDFFAHDRNTWHLSGNHRYLSHPCGLHEPCLLPTPHNTVYKSHCLIIGRFQAIFGMITQSYAHFPLSESQWTNKNILLLKAWLRLDFFPYYSFYLLFMVCRDNLLFVQKPSWHMETWNHYFKWLKFDSILKA